LGGIAFGPRYPLQLRARASLAGFPLLSLMQGSNALKKVASFIALGIDAEILFVQNPQSTGIYYCCNAFNAQHKKIVANSPLRSKRPKKLILI
jgi:hypothetical protein